MARTVVRSTQSVNGGTVILIAQSPTINSHRRYELRMPSTPFPTVATRLLLQFKRGRSVVRHSLFIAAFALLFACLGCDTSTRPSTDPLFFPIFVC